MTGTSFMRKMPLLFCKLQAKLEFTKLRNNTLSKGKGKKNWQYIVLKNSRMKSRMKSRSVNLT